MRSVAESRAQMALSSLTISIVAVMVALSLVAGFAVRMVNDGHAARCDDRHVYRLPVFKNRSKGASPRESALFEYRL